MKNKISWVVLAMLLAGSITGTYRLSDTFRKDALKIWKLEVDQTAQLLTGTIINWVEQSYSPLLGLASLFENSSSVSKEEFLGAINSIQSRATRQFLDYIFVLRPTGKGEAGKIVYANFPIGLVISRQSLINNPEIRKSFFTSTTSPGQIIIRPPTTVSGSRYSAVSLAIEDKQGPLVLMGLLNHDTLIEGMFAVHESQGLSVHIKGRFLGEGGPGPEQTVEGEPLAEPAHSFQTGAASGRADFTMTWYADSSFGGGPQDTVADVFLVGGSIAGILLTLFIGLLLRQNTMIQRRVTEATSELQENRRQLQLALETSGIGIWEWDIGNDTRHWDEGHLRIMGVDRDNQPGDHEGFLELIHPDDRKSINEKIDAVLAGNEDYENEFRILRPDGEIRVVSNKGYLQRDEAGQPLRMVGTSMDITNQKEAAEKLQQSRQQLKALFDALPVGVVMIAPSGKILEANIVSERILGISADEHRMRSLQSGEWRIVRPDGTDMPAVEYPASRALSGEGIIKNVEMGVFQPDGSLVWINTSAAPISEEAGGGVAVAFEDITERKTMTSELEGKNILMKALIDSPRDILIFSLDTQYRYTAFNLAHALEMQLIYGTDISVGMSMLDAVTNPDMAQSTKSILDRVLAGEAFTDVQQQPDTDIVYEFNWGPVRNSENRIIGLSAFIRDISDLNKMEAELKKKLQEQDEAQSAMLNMMEDLDEEKAVAEGATRAKSDFLANMSHEIRTPMNAILGLTHLCLQTDLTKKQNDYLTKVHSSAQSLLGLINDILDFSKIEAGKLDMEAIDFSIDEILNNVSTLVAIKAQEKGLELLFEIPGDIPRCLIGDPLRVGQVLINLANNAVKFTETGEVVVAVELLEASEQSVKLQFVVRDTGIGLTQEQIDKLFQSFSQADTSTTRKYGGTGLGLTISKRLVELMHGEIWVESQPGEGSSFIFTAVFGRQIGRQKGEPVTAPDLKGMKALIVDDNTSSREIFVGMLKQFEFAVEEIDSGVRAVEMVVAAAEAPYQLVLLDWKMPIMDGIETARTIRELSGLETQPKIVLATAFDREEARQRAVGVDIDAFLSKPVTASQLFDAIMRAFGKVAGPVDDRDDRAGFNLGELKPIHGARILLVEDNEINQQVARELLEKASLVVDIANHGREGVEMLEAAEYDVVLMDIQMPVMDGYEATHEIRKTRPADSLPILAMTASATVDDRQRALDSGMNDHIAKPIEPRQLYSGLLKWIEPGEREVPEYLAAAAVPEAKKGVEAGLPGELPGIDIAAGLLRVGDNHNLYLKLLKKFRKNQDQAVLLFQGLIEAGEIEDAVRTAHTLKGVSGNIGAEALHEATRELETAAKELGAEVPERLLTAVQQQLDIVLSSIDRLSSPTGREKPVDTGASLDMEQVKPLLDELRAFLEDDDTEASSVLEKLQSLINDSDLLSVLEAVEDGVSGYDFEEALEKLVEFEKRLLRS